MAQMTGRTPGQLTSLPLAKMIDGISSKSFNILPVNSSASTEFDSANNRVVFNIPAYKGFLNPKRSYVSFTGRIPVNKDADTNEPIAAAASFADGVPVFDRMTVSSNGVMLEDVQGYDLCKSLKDNLKSPCALFNTAMHGDYRVNASKPTHALDVAAGITYRHELMSGILGSGQDYFIPVGHMAASGGHAFEITLYLAKKSTACTSKVSGQETQDFKLSNVMLNLEIVTLPADAERGISANLARDGVIKIPFKSFRQHVSHIGENDRQVDISISESAHNVERIMIGIRDQTLSQITTGFTKSRLSTLGGKQAVKDGDKLEQWQIRYGTEMFPQQPVYMNGGDSTSSLLHGLATMDLLDKSVFIAGGDVYSTTAFAIYQGFKTTRDQLVNGLNSSSTGAPLIVSMKFGSGTGTAKRVESFVQSSSTLNVSAGGLTTLIDYC
jgi:hypothetical protein